MKKRSIQVTVFAPARLSLAGGGTDLAAFYKRQPGRVLSFAINLGITITATHLSGTNLRLLHLPDLGADLWFSPGEHPTEGQVYLAALALDTWSGDRGYEVTVKGDFKPGGGLGGSGAMCVGLYAALMQLKGRKWTQRQAARQASRLEIELAGRPIGQQDQYASSLGGINLLTFTRDSRVICKKLTIPSPKDNLFPRCFLLFEMGVQRDSGLVLHQQRRSTEDGEKATICNLAVMAHLAHTMSKLLQKGDLEAVGGLLRQAWEKKKQLASNISDAQVDNALEAAIRVGAWGGKVCGAGAGGHLLVMGPPQRRDNIQNTVTSYGYRECSFKLEQEGVHVVAEQDA